MHKFPAILGCLVALLAVHAHSGEVDAAEPVARPRIAVVSSYHREYLWSQDTQRGVVAALREHGYIDGGEADVFTATDRLDSAKVQLLKLWMDTKRRNSAADIAAATARVVGELEAFAPDILLLGDDNAVAYVGYHYLDADLPVVFWGVNGDPMKYGLLDTLARPGHNVTGVYQAGYLREGLEALKTLLPELRRFAVLSDGSPTGRSKAKEFRRRERNGELAMELVDVVITNSFAEWRTRALDLAPRVDAFFVLNHSTLRDAAGRNVDQMVAGRWYLENIRKPDIAQERQFVEEGMLAAVEDSGFKQGYEAVGIAHRILSHGVPAGDIAVTAPTRGPFIVNLERARMLGIQDRIRAHPVVDETVERSLALSGR